MSKSRGNVVAPDDEIDQHGTDAFRCQLMFVGPWDQGGPYNPTGMSGIVRWLHRLWTQVTEPIQLHKDPGSEATRDFRRTTHKTIIAATEEIENFRFNTLISRLMEHTSAMQRARESGPVDHEAWEEAVTSAILMTAPLAPHLAEELWERVGGAFSVHTQRWPKADAELARDDEVEIAVQVNGKVRERVILPAACSEADARTAVFALPRIQEQLAGAEPKRIIYVPGKLFSIVI
jgi:leucyl-tRNA synthetase